jgi:hypothetical protein
VHHTPHTTHHTPHHTPPGKKKKKLEKKKKKLFATERCVTGTVHISEIPRKSETATFSLLFSFLQIYIKHTYILKNLVFIYFIFFFDRTPKKKSDSERREYTAKNDKNNMPSIYRI